MASTLGSALNGKRLKLREKLDGTAFALQPLHGQRFPLIRTAGQPQTHTHMDRERRGKTLVKPSCRQSLAQCHPKGFALLEDRHHEGLWVNLQRQQLTVTGEVDPLRPIGDADRDA